jgi:phosphatidate cytidylyltransferase
MSFDDESRIPDDGVRIIGPDEAAERLERDDVAHRRRSDEPRFGVRSEQPVDRDPRPTIRFPLAADEAPRPAGTPAPGPSRDDDTALPHWTEPPTGEVPRIFAAEDLGEEDPGGWSGFSTGQPRWRGEGPERHDEFDDFSRLADDETRIGALADDERPDPEDFFAFDDERWEDEPEPATVGAGGEEWYDEEDEASAAAGAGRAGTRSISSDPRRARQTRTYERPQGTGRDMPTAVGVGAAFAVVALICFKLGPTITVALVALVLAVAAVELFNVLRQAGYQPAILLGTAACVALPLAAYYKGESGIPLALFLTVVFGMIWYLSGAGGDDRPVIGLSSTLLGVGWIGVLGSFAALMLVLPTTKDGVGEPGIGVLLVAVLGTFAYDIGGLFVGRNAGTRPLSAASPNKTVEGLVGGVVAAVVVTVIASVLIAPFKELDFMAGLLVGVAVAVAAPLGDLCQSLIKRDLDVKDMGTILPGHGGFLDRFDGLLFVLPVVYYFARILLY